MGICPIALAVPLDLEYMNYHQAAPVAVSSPGARHGHHNLPNIDKEGSCATQISDPALVSESDYDIWPSPSSRTLCGSNYPHWLYTSSILYMQNPKVTFLESILPS